MATAALEELRAAEGKSGGAWGAASGGGKKRRRLGRCEQRRRKAAAGEQRLVTCPVSALVFNKASDPGRQATRAGVLAPRRRKQPRKLAKDDMQTVLILGGCKIPGFVNRG